MNEFMAWLREVILKIIHVADPPIAGKILAQYYKIYFFTTVAGVGLVLERVVWFYGIASVTGFWFPSGLERIYVFMSPCCQH